MCLALPQAVISHSVFVLDWTRPVALSEFFLPLDDALAFDDYRDCLTTRDLRWTSYSPMVASDQTRNETAVAEAIKAAEGKHRARMLRLLCLFLPCHRRNQRPSFSCNSRTCRSCHLMLVPGT